nr:glucan 1,3-beta-glucosidase [Quercus suber]
MKTTSTRFNPTSAPPSFAATLRPIGTARSKSSRRRRTRTFKSFSGFWPDTDESFNADKVALSTCATQYTDQVYAVTVGSETLYRGNYTGEQLLEKITDVKSILPNNKDVDDGAVYTYFDDIQQALGRVQQMTGSLDQVEFWNGETGWPTDGGSDYGAAKASTASAAKYYLEAVCGLLDWGVDVFFFEAFDENDGSAADETHWGAMTADRALKDNYSRQCQSNSS